MKDEVLDELIRREELQSLNAALGRVDSRCADAIRAYYGLGGTKKTQVAMARALGVSDTAIYARIKRGIARIRRHPKTCREFAVPVPVRRAWWEK